MSPIVSIKYSVCRPNAVGQNVRLSGGIRPKVADKVSSKRRKSLTSPTTPDRFPTCLQRRNDQKTRRETFSRRNGDRIILGKHFYYQNDLAYCVLFHHSRR